MAYEDERMSIFFRISRLETIVGDFQKEHDLGKCTNQPLKELVDLRKRNKDLKHKIECMDESSGIQQETICHLKSLAPEPCIKFCGASDKELIAKLMEEVIEIVTARSEYTVKPNGDNKKNLLRELVDVSTVIRTIEMAWNDQGKEIADMQEWVNKHNRERGYMDGGNTDEHLKEEP